ncbi:hypothetical protein R1sor_027064 [Riccia sorocarpa]|uniref:CCHC-type domain-containing protein n=1 Tax=Riccia sorocarpa TaxID=122646 RepID=A0ABD3GEV1_9MARC
MMAAELSHLPIFEDTTAGEDVDVRIIEVNFEKAAQKLSRFRQLAIVLQAIESTPSRDRVVAWLREALTFRRGVQITQVKVLERREFLIVFETVEDKEMVMDRPPQFLDGKLVWFIDWEHRGSAKILPHLKPAWIELRDIPSFLEDQADDMIKALGPVVYHSLDKQNEMRYADVRGCIVVDMSQELPAKTGLKTPWGKIYLQTVIYTKLPDRCFICLKEGHIVKGCPNKKERDIFCEQRQAVSKVVHPNMEVREIVSKAVETKNQPEVGDGFQSVPNKGRKNEKPRRRDEVGNYTADSNRYNALHVNEVLGGEDEINLKNDRPMVKTQLGEVQLEEDEDMAMIDAEAIQGVERPEKEVVVLEVSVPQKPELWSDIFDKEEVEGMEIPSEDSNMADLPSFSIGLEDHDMDFQLSPDLDREVIRRS